MLLYQPQPLQKSAPFQRSKKAKTGSSKATKRDEDNASNGGDVGEAEDEILNASDWGRSKPGNDGSTISYRPFKKLGRKGWDVKRDIGELLTVEGLINLVKTLTVFTEDSSRMK